MTYTVSFADLKGLSPQTRNAAAYEIAGMGPAAVAAVPGADDAAHCDTGTTSHWIRLSGNRGQLAVSYRAGSAVSPSSGTVVSATCTDPSSGAPSISSPS